MLPWLRPHWGRILLGCVLTLASVPAATFHAFAWGYTVEEVIVNRRLDRLGWVVVAVCAAQLAHALLTALRGALLERLGCMVVCRLRCALYEKLVSQPLSRVDRQRVGDLSSRVVGDADALQEMVVQGTDSTLSSAATCAYIVGVLLVLNWRLALATLVPVAGIWLFTRAYTGRVLGWHRATRARLGDLAARAQESLSGLAVIKAFGQEEQEAARFRKLSEEAMESAARTARARSLFFPAVGFLGFAASVSTLGLGAWMVVRGEFTLGGLVAFRSFWWPLMTQLNVLAGVGDMLQRAEAAGARVFEILDAPDEMADAPAAAPLRVDRGRVEFRGVTFRHPGGSEEAGLRDVTFAAERGEIVAIVGPSGAGKTTLLHLAARFHDPDEGAVLIDSQDLRGVTRASLRASMALVSQEPLLFAGTVLECIRYGRPDASRQEVLEAARLACAEEFIARLPRELDTEVGERGAGLSGGQRQRIAIARAFLKDPRLLLLDEPTSSVEPESEAALLEALQRLMHGRTTLLTSHRPALVRHAHRILVLQDGRLVEQGSHEALMRRGGLYAAMQRTQDGPGRAGARPAAREAALSAVPESA